MGAAHRPAPAHKTPIVRRAVNNAKPVVRVARAKPIRVPARPASTTQKLVESSFALQTRPIPWVRPAGCDKNPTLAMHSIKRLKTLARLTGGRVFPGHDPEFWKSVPQAPATIT